PRHPGHDMYLSCPETPWLRLLQSRIFAMGHWAVATQSQCAQVSAQSRCSSSERHLLRTVGSSERLHPTPEETAKRHRHSLPKPLSGSCLLQQQVTIRKYWPQTWPLPPKTHDGSRPSATSEIVYTNMYSKIQGL